MQALDQFKQDNFEEFIFKRGDAASFIENLPLALDLDLYFHQNRLNLGLTQASLNIVADEHVFRVLAFGLIYSALIGGQNQMVFGTTVSDAFLVLLRNSADIDSIAFNGYKINECVYVFNANRFLDDLGLAIDLYLNPIFDFALDSQPHVYMEKPIPVGCKRLGLIGGTTKSRVNLARQLLDLTHPSDPFKGLLSLTNKDLAVSVGNESIDAHFVLRKYIDQPEFAWVKE